MTGLIIISLSSPTKTLRIGPTLNYHKHAGTLILAAVHVSYSRARAHTHTCTRLLQANLIRFLDSYYSYTPTLVGNRSFSNYYTN